MRIKRSFLSGTIFIFIFSIAVILFLRASYEDPKVAEDLIFEGNEMRSGLLPLDILRSDKRLLVEGSNELPMEAMIVYLEKRETSPPQGS